MNLTDNRSKIKHIRELQRQTPYEAPINVKQVCNMPFGEGLRVDYYEPMAYSTRTDMASYLSANVVVMLADEPFLADKNELAPFAMEMAKRGLRVFVPGVCRAKDDGFYTQLDNLFSFLSALRVDAFGLGLSLATGVSQGSPLVLMGCGTGAMLASVCMQLHGSYAMRAFFAAHCPVMHAYFDMGTTPDVDLAQLPVLGGFVSLCGLLQLSMAPSWRDYVPWFRTKVGQKLYDYLSFGTNLYLTMPAVLLVTTATDPFRRQARHVSDCLEQVGLQCRLLDNPKQDEEKRELEPLFHVYYPMWTISRRVNDDIAAFCKGVGLPAVR